MTERNHACEDLGTGKQTGMDGGAMSLDAGETEGRPPGPGPTQSCRVAKGRAVLGLEAVAIATAAVHVFQ